MRLKILGNRDVSPMYVRFGRKLLKELKIKMNAPKGVGHYSHLQGKDTKPLPGGGRITVKNIAGNESVEIYTPSEVEEEEIVEDEYGDIFYYVVMWFTFPVGAFYEYSKLCSVYDIKLKKTATNIPANNGDMAFFPCDPALISNWKQESISAQYIQPIYAQPLFSGMDEGDSSDWDSGTHRPWPDDAMCSNESKSNSSLRTNYHTDIDGIQKNFTDKGVYQCTHEEARSPYYYPDTGDGSDGCCIFAGHLCSGYAEGTFSREVDSYEHKTIEINHGLPVFAGSYGEDLGIYYEIPTGSYRLDFDYGLSGATANYTVHKITISDDEIGEDRTRTWEIIPLSCYPPGGTPNTHDKYTVTAGTLDRISSGMNGVTDVMIKTALGNISWPNQFDIWERDDHARNDDGSVEGELPWSEQWTNGKRVHCRFFRIASPPRLYGEAFSGSGDDTDSGNCYFKSAGDQPNENTAIVQVYGCLGYNKETTCYDAAYVEPIYGYTYDLWTWKETSKTNTIITPKFIASIDMPVTDSDDPQDVLDNYDIRDMIRVPEFEVFFNDLAEALYYQALEDFPGMSPSHGSTIMYFRDQAIIQYPFIDKPE